MVERNAEFPNVGLPLLVVILGPTASGKTALSVALGARFGGEVVSCDSIAIYRGFEIGSAKPSPEQRERVPHHLLDVANPEEPYTAGDYGRAARAAIGDIAARGKLPIVSGGSGLYLRALLQGFFAGSQPGSLRSAALRTRLQRRFEDRGAARLHRLLRRLDPVSAGRIHPNDASKVIRAVEVSLLARQPLSELWRTGREGLSGFRILRIGLNPDRSQLYERINARARSMFASGLVEETEALLARCSAAGATARCSALQSLGYRQAAQFLRGEIDRERAVALTCQGHRNYAKRQQTWFRREPAVAWLAGFGDQPEIRGQAEKLVRQQLAERSSPDRHDDAALEGARQAGSAN